MSIFKCKMCGGTIEFEQGATVGVCDSCGSKQTLPKLDDDRRANLYDRANHFRRNNEFDKAAGIYEQILNEDGTDAEAYWSLVLCRYGIEYVEDPATKRRVPTVNRAQYTSIFDDDNYKSALQYADIAQKILYEQEAKEINEIQKGILEISSKEQPFDVFICYKETDANGRRTPDSVLANDLYHQLTNEGFKVFFSRITLEDKLGTAYEPYIFAALNSAKVMVALGTKPEYFNAVWVKNEWSRYLALVKQSKGKKTLIPAYRDMDPYDLPEEFSHLQAQDMSKLGFMQDLIRGIKKLTQAEAPKQTTVKETVVVNGGAVANAAPLLKRAFMFLEDGDWAKADEFCEQVLNLDPENAQAYLGKLMAELHAKKKEDLRDCREPFDGKNNYQKALRFGDVALKEELQGYVRYIKERNEQARLTGIYEKALQSMREAGSESDYKAAAEIFRSIPGFRDADDKVKECLEKAEIVRKDAIYVQAQKEMERFEDAAAFNTAISLFKQIPGWKDADEQIKACQKKIEEIRQKAEEAQRELERKLEEERIAAENARRKKKRTTTIVVILISLLVTGWLGYTYYWGPQQKYTEAVALYSAGKYEEAIKAFTALNGYKDSKAKLNDANEMLLPQRLSAMKTAKNGSIVQFGHYEQDNNTSNGKEEIEWIVLDKQGTKLLLISKYALDCQKYNSSSASVTWETCTLRTWLNGTFLNAAFSSAEQKQIVTTKVQNRDNSKYNTKGGNATTDKVFLLSIDEANKSFSSNSARTCAGTTYAYARGAYGADNGNCRWWLRSPGSARGSAARVNFVGDVDYDGLSVDNDGQAVRPALWIDLVS